ncbi:PREDICTED: BAG domain-containing protein Samui-like isoform X2 [Ceratosolen solmsi marchali]|uniref:BAG domain-containing protein Samui-like isoform X2 n=1 Tax=Ceratosolen solmsi marchali TaxID=326594 RepID=A0AAJ7DV92_9HYME|nr:PREDICTED: BAG domain-containing protein Samui-like isoform X2 [Ceratosolen solmsi marchali]
MDSPIIVDNATKFGRGIDLDRGFPGFPFDDEGFGRRADIRSHLDDLAARHPEFADQLLGPPWADVPFPGGGGGDGGGGGGLLNRANRNRRSSGGTVHNLPEEDTRSQASSQGSGEVESERKSQRIPQYGLRNTLDIGQHQHSMENPQQQRNVRSMSAPPENRNNQGENIGSQHPGHRFVSRVDITPQGPQQQPLNHNQQHQRDKSPAPTQKPQPQSQQQGNVRHIPIFVEGRDEPVLAKTSTDEPDYPKRQQSPPQFHRPSHYQQHYEKQHPSSEWTSHFQDPFFKVPNRWGSRTQQSHQPEPPQPTNQRPKPQPQTQPQHKQQQQQQHQHHHQQQHPQQRYHQPQQQSEVHQEASPKLKQTQPRDPFERVAMVQKEVDSLTDQVRQYGGGSRQDKQYMYLDEMLTRELIKLDDIETEGKENVRQARKQAIKSIQDSIGLLESKAPLPGQHQHQQQQQLLEEQKQSVIEPMESENKPMETMETSEPHPPNGY